MATYGTAVRRGLPRRPGGEAWPPAGTAPADVVDAASVATPMPSAEIPDAAPVAAAVAAAVAESAKNLRPGPATTTVSQESGPVGESATNLRPGLAATTVSQESGSDVESATNLRPGPAATTVSQESGPVADTSAAAAQAVSADAGGPAATATAPARIRRGLPRVPGGEPWPPADFAASSAAVADAVAEGATNLRPGTAATAVSQESGPVAAPAAVTPPETTAAPPAPSQTPSTGQAPSTSRAPSTAQAPAPAAAVAAGEAVTVRRGLPRVPGGEPWPPADFVAGPVAMAADTAPAAQAPAAAPTPATQDASAETIVVEQTAPDGETRTTEVVAAAASGTDVTTPLPFTRTVWQGAAAQRFEEERRAGVAIAKSEPKRIGPFTRVQWAGIVVIGGAALLIAAGMAVALVRWLLSTEWGVDFLATYPGEYHLPEGAPVGFPPWLGWQHFFNVFLIVLIIRSGLQVRTEKRPSAFWSPRNNAKRKISLNLWFHQSLDILWIVNGVIFVVLLFVSGQWMRIVPTSWEVFPNAVSAILQYISLDWPTENGWANYNSIQQIAYFTTVFVAAPLAIVTGVRMSGIWPKNAKALNKAYPVEWARAVHFPTMLYFVAFIAVHVFLVFATGALRNLNHMYAAQGSLDPNAYADNWTGFWFFFASLVVIAGAWIAARPLVLAPIARLFGNVSGR